jgi:hypothetical protein
MKRFLKDLIPVILISLYPVVFLYAHNKGENILPMDVVKAILVSALAGILHYGFVTKWFRSSHPKILTVYFMICFSFMGQIKEHLMRDFPKIPELATYGGLAIALAGIYFLILRSTPKIKLSHETEGKLGTVFFVFVLTLIFQNVFKIVNYDIEISKKQTAILPELHLKFSEVSEKPNIYLFLLDGYSSQETLRRFFHFDNSQFISALSKKGFKTLSESRSNYSTTSLSVPSLLNFAQWADFKDQIQSRGRDAIMTIREHGLNSRTLRILKKLGYKIVHFLSGDTTTVYNKYADINIDVFQPNLFWILYLKMSALNPLLNKFDPYKARDRLNFQMDKINEISQSQTPYFMFIHFMCPHPPFIFNADGSTRSKIDLSMTGNAWADKDAYINQMQFLNGEMLKEIDKLLVQKPNAVILILSDHGAASFDQWSNPSEDFLFERMTNFISIHANAETLAKYTANMSLLNIVPVTLNSYFHLDIPLQKDVTYFSSYDDLFKFQDVTDIINKKYQK